MRKFAPHPNVKVLLRAVRRASGYDHFHIWEPATDYDKTNSNYPFKPQFFGSSARLPEGMDPALLEEFTTRADNWDGGLSDWAHALKEGRVGHVFDFYVTRVNDELVTNIEVWIKSETEAVWSDCGGPERSIKL